MPMSDPMPPEDLLPVKIDGVAKKRVFPKFWIARDPEGHEHIIAAENRRDWCLRPGHTLVAPVGAQPEPEAPVPDGNAKPAVVTAADEKVAEIMGPLEELRDKARSLGIEIDNRWGKKRLIEAIEAAEADDDTEFDESTNTDPNN